MSHTQSFTIKLKLVKLIYISLDVWNMRFWIALPVTLCMVVSDKSVIGPTVMCTLTFHFITHNACYHFNGPLVCGVVINYHSSFHIRNYPHSSTLSAAIYRPAVISRRLTILANQLLLMYLCHMRQWLGYLKKTL